jgi:hypothetical protein
MKTIRDTDEIAFQWPLPSHGLQKRLTSSTVNECVCFAPGYPAWEMLTFGVGADE